MNPPLNPKVFHKAAKRLERLEARDLNDFACCAISEVCYDEPSFSEPELYKEFFCDLFGNLNAARSCTTIFGRLCDENTQTRIFALYFAAEVLESGTTQLDIP